MSGRIDYNGVIRETRKLLGVNQEWRRRYAEYAAKIFDNEEYIKENRKRFHEWEPLRFYLNVTNAKGAAKSLKLDVRYLGQTVAALTVCGEGVKLSTGDSSKDYAATNLRDFDCDIVLNDCDWGSPEGRAFRSHFENNRPVRGERGNRKNEEHRIESLLLAEFSRKDSGKALRGIQPVKIADIRFPMPTPLSASKHGEIRYSGYHGGGIDILARTGSGGAATRLCVIELKDDNKPGEPASAALEQAVACTVFIRELLRSDAGADWWRLFGFGGEIPKPLTLYAACAMPDIMDADKSFVGDEYDIDGDKIVPHYISFHFDETDGALTIDTSLPTI